MDKRILRTKKALKGALMELLKEENFETITVTEICETAMISRNTFYNYYVDKYALLEDCFQDYEALFEQHLDSLQKKNNPQNDMRKSFMNMIDTFLDTEAVYESIPLLSSFDLMSVYYHAFMDILKKHEDNHNTFINPDYDQTQLNSFLVLGFWGFIHENQKMDRETIKKNTRKLVQDLLDSPVFLTTDK